MNTHSFDDKPATIAKDKGGICVSIIVPTHRTSPERMVDMPEVKKAIDKVKSDLLKTYFKTETAPLLQALDNIFGRIDFNHNNEGIGLFVSAHVQELVPFFIPVKKKIMIGRSFDIRDRIDQEYYAQPYLVLQLSEKEAKLYYGSFDQLKEIKDNNFPSRRKDDYEYSRPSRGNSYVGQAATQGFEKDKTYIETIRYERFLKTVDAAINQSLISNPLLLVSGSQQSVSLFKKISKAALAGEIVGNYWYAPLNELGLLCCKTVQSFLNKRKEERIAAFKESIEGHSLTSQTSLYAIWKAVVEGRGLQLLVERDFSLPGYFVKGNENKLYLHPLLEEHDMVSDVVNRMMEIVLEKRGKVFLVDNDALADYGRIGLLMRY
ncbi:MAG: baeRF3 domain-containing protein [Flavisolibacter sp.]